MSTPEHRAAVEKWRQANKERVAAYQREYRKKHPEKLKEADRRKYKKRADEIKLKQKEMRQDPNYVYPRQSYPNLMNHAAKVKARKKNLPFDLTVEYIASIWPTDNQCPVFGTLFETAAKGTSRDTSPSLDRKIPSLGYIQGNVHVISMKANRIKNDASLEDLQRILAYFEPLLRK